MLDWTSDDAFVIDGVEYVCCPLLRHGFRSEPGRFCMVKPRSAVEAYDELVREAAPDTIVEVGLHDGASTAFLADRAGPSKLVGIELSERPLPALDDFVARRGLEDVLSVHLGVDQADAARVGAIVADELGDRGLDLVVDDASHLLEPTRRAFNCLFPRLRPGGSYVIEDWWWAHTYKSEVIWPDETPLSVMVFELILACAYEPEVVADVTSSRNWTIVTRGDAPLDDGPFDLSQRYGARGRALVTDL